jgi:hypothetical protein
MVVTLGKGPLTSTPSSPPWRTIVPTLVPTCRGCKRKHAACATIPNCLQMRQDGVTIERLMCAHGCWNRWDVPHAQRVDSSTGKLVCASVGHHSCCVDMLHLVHQAPHRVLYPYPTHPQQQEMKGLIPTCVPSLAVVLVLLTMVLVVRVGRGSCSPAPATSGPMPPA